MTIAHAHSFVNSSRMLLNCSSVSACVNCLYTEKEDAVDSATDACELMLLWSTYRGRMEGTTEPTIQPLIEVGGNSTTSSPHSEIPSWRSDAWSSRLGNSSELTEHSSPLKPFRRPPGVCSSSTVWTFGRSIVGPIGVSGNSSHSESVSAIKRSGCALREVSEKAHKGLCPTALNPRHQCSIMLESEKLRRKMRAV